MTADVHEFSTSGSALATVSTELGSAGVGWLYAPGLLDRVRIRVTPVSAGRRCSSGSVPPRTSIATSGVNHTVITEFWEEKVEAAAGGAPAAAPERRTSGSRPPPAPEPGPLEWDPTDGSWTVVVMNTDGRPGIDVGADLGQMPAVLWIALGVLIRGGGLPGRRRALIAGAIRGRRAGQASPA